MAPEPYQTREPRVLREPFHLREPHFRRDFEPVSRNLLPNRPPRYPISRVYIHQR